ncbi:hypothetical protein SEA_SIXAMA_105 [Gordonia phage Sixama]|uniref:Minor tail protein n=1 Tax=Gordonia phage Sixama TaxID=2653271 RepID=A0A5Q2F5C2_9CAUD|nr:hypothetical protein PP302_gp105 [Gordonia phage Sixama]QGF20284.1 hypothetical protein SEA_SIXAMA_105 [Gordonia phage Sixama]
MLELPFSISKADVPAPATSTSEIPARAVQVELPGASNKLDTPQRSQSYGEVPGNFDVLIFGPAAQSSSVAFAGTISTVRVVSIIGPIATSNASAVTGNTAVMEEIPGQTIVSTALARAGVVSAQRQPTISGPVASGSSQAWVGLITAIRNVSLAGTQSTGQSIAYTDSIIAIRNLAVAGVRAQASGASSAGIAAAIRNVNLPGVLAPGSAAAPAGLFENVVHALVLGVLSTGNGQAAPGTVLGVSNTEIAGALANGDALSLAGAIATVRNAAINGLVSGTTAAQAFNALVQAIRNAEAIAATSSSSSSTAFAGAVVAEMNYSVQRMNKLGDFAISGSVVQATGWQSHAPTPAVIVSDALDVQGGGASTVHTTLWITRNSTSGNIVLNLVINGSVVDTFSITSASTITGSGRPHYLVWNGTLNASDDVTISVGRTISTSGALLAGSYVQVDPGNTTYQMRRMWKSTSQTPGTTRTQVSSMVADSRYGSSLSSNSLVVDMAGTGTARAAVQITNTHATSTCTAYLVKNGTDIGSVTFGAAEDGTKWIEVPTTFVSGDLLRLDAIRDSAGGRTVGLGTTIEAKIPV